ncbi:MAG: hypothetical protein V1708_00590 [Candidatus Micrarchaeota archaeon]
MADFSIVRDEPRAWLGGIASATEDGHARGGKVRKPSLIVSFMTLLEDYTPIKAVRDPNLNSFEDGMFRVGLFGLNQRQIFILVTVGLAYALLQMG